jgi:hypothetical protein
LGFTRGDIILIAAAAALAALFALAGTRFFASEADTVEIRTGGADVVVYPLQEDRTVEARGPKGTTVVVIRGGRVSVAASPCRDGLCMKMGPIGKEGGVIACVPNEVVVTVSASGAETFDAVAR